MKNGLSNLFEGVHANRLKSVFSNRRNDKAYEDRRDV